MLSYGAMKASTDRILTTHTGSLPRPDDLTALLEALDTGSVPDIAAFEARVRQAVADIVRQQREAGVDIVSDGEQGKVGYSTYVRHRLTGFGGRSVPGMRADWADFPKAAARAERRSTVERPTCNGPIDWKDRTAVGTGGPGYTLQAEIRLKHSRGSVAMGCLPENINPTRQSNGSQFYVCLQPIPSQDGKDTVFGQVVFGLDALNEISRLPADSNANPLERVEVRRTYIVDRSALGRPVKGRP